MTNSEAVTYTFQRMLMTTSFTDPEAPRWVAYWREAVDIRKKYGGDADWEESLRMKKVEIVNLHHKDTRAAVKS